MHGRLKQLWQHLEQRHALYMFSAVIGVEQARARVLECGSVQGLHAFVSVDQASV